MRKTLPVAVVCLCCHAHMFSQIPSIPGSRLTVSSSVPGKVVYIDSVEAGRTPFTATVDSGKHTVCLVPGDRLDWGRYHECRTIHLDPSNDSEVFFVVPLQMEILSDPYGAEVRYRDSIIGTTPCMFTTFSSKGSITLSRGGLEDLVMVFDSSTALLYGKLTGRVGSIDQANLYLEAERAGNTASIVIAASSAVLTGAGAAYFKIRADNLYNDYRTTGDARSLYEVRQLDVLSAISLAASQVSLTLLIYFLVSN